MRNIKNIDGTPLFPVVSLFSGAMGLDIGLMQAGLNVAVSQDYDKWCVETIKKNGHVGVLGDIRELINQDPSCDFLLKAGKLKKDSVFAVVGGPPCQSFSTAGKRLGVEDERGQLYNQFIHVVDQLRPRFFVMENVKGLASTLVDPGDKQSLPLLEHILQKFKALGYHTVHGVLDAVHYGTPQFRERLVIIGSRDKEAIFLPSPTHFHIHQNEGMRWRTLFDAIGDIEDPGPCAKFTPAIMEYLHLVPEGGNWKSLPPGIAKKAMGGAYESGGGKVGFYRRLPYSEPSPTLVTSPNQKATLLGHPRELRPLSVKEYARIQQFPDSWVFEGKITDCYRQIGNAVPIPLGRAIGQMLVAVALGKSEIRVKRMRGTSVHDSMRQMSQALAGK
ncbi:DNA cytosine methyltransferase [Comamonas avium]|uniref:DNA (cytosine-5-)-methyltransferase n=1 Tax=Comamonas avium TaxID=2762231 RepID=A0ABR8SDU5_9BURK|nr:DNA cytosine methyltransferase [Comamonas avium]MBD7961657.1 DNA cytosine methyltransferase [Comamonas avium]